jgi:serine protease inhibitor
MQSRFLYFVLPGLFAFLPATPGKFTHNPPHPEFVLSHNQFAFRLLDAVCAQDSSNSNKLVSPLSLYLTLGMLYNGAAHETRDSLAEVMQAADIELPNLNGLCKETMQQLPLEDDQVQFNFANAIWYNRHKLTLLPEYEQLMENFYYTPVEPLDFGSHAAAIHINDWVSHNTSEEINNVIANTSPSDAMILVNALYFKSAWQKPFEVNDSYKGDFYLGDDFAHQVTYMRKKSVIRTFSDTSFTMVELPCGQGRNFALYVLLPQNQDQSVRSWLPTLAPARLNDAIDKMTPQFVDLSLPRWECTYSLGDTHAILARLGIGATFTVPGEADFSNMYTAGAHKAAVTRIFHDTHIRVDEDGLVASAASGAQMTLGISRDGSNPRVVRFDHPFAYLLMERKHELILMAGVVNDPMRVRTSPPPPPSQAHHRLRSILNHLHPHSA